MSPEELVAHKAAELLESCPMVMLMEEAGPSAVPLLNARRALLPRVGPSTKRIETREGLLMLLLWCRCYYFGSRK